MHAHANTGSYTHTHTRTSEVPGKWNLPDDSRPTPRARLEMFTQPLIANLFDLIRSENNLPENCGKTMGNALNTYPKNVYIISRFPF